MLSVCENFEEMHLKNKEARVKVEGILRIAKEWALHEEVYLNGMKNIFTQVAKAENNGVVQGLKEVVHGIVLKSEEFAREVNEKVVKQLDEFLVNQCKSVKKAYIDGKKITEYMSELHENAVENMNVYHAAIYDCDQMAIKLDNEINEGKKLKLLKTLIQMQRDLKGKFFKFQDSLAGYNSDWENYNSGIKKIVEAYNFHEEKIKENYEKTISLLVEFYLRKITLSKLEFPNEVKVKLPCSVFSLENFKLPEITLGNISTSHPLFTNSNCIRNFSILETTGLPGLTDMVESIYKLELEDLVNRAWQGVDLIPNDYLRFNTIIKTEIGRKTWVFCLNLKRNQGNFALSTQGYSKIGELLLSVLNECERYKDIETANNIMILSQTFYQKTTTSKEFLQSFLVCHSIWKDLSFWEASINSTIFQELKKQKTQNFEENAEIKAMNHKSLIFCHLVSFGNIMPSFEIPMQNVEKLIKTYAKRYKFTKAESKEIIKAISDSITKC